MKITVHKVRSVKRRETLRDAANMFLRELLPQHVIAQLEINVVFRSHMKDWGGCTPTYTPLGRPKKFKIEIQPHRYSQRRMLKTLAHECVHVKQYALGEMYEPGGTVTLWKSRKFDHEEIPYSKHPWEIEAQGNEENLWQLWRDRRRA